MRIEFDPSNPTEAAAVRAMLTATEVHMGTSADPVRIPDSPRFAVSQATIDTLPVGPLAEKLDEYYVPREAIPTGVTDDGWQTVEAGPATDSTGTPWDERIHSTPSTTNKDGTWRAKRGVTADQIAQVRAEREAMSAETQEVVAMGGAADPS